MDRVYESGASAAPPIPPAVPSVGYPSRGNAASGQMPSVVGPYMFHQLVEELMAVIAAGNIVPNKLVLNQLKLALDAVYVKKNGTSPILQNFAGLTRALTPLGGAQLREYVDIPNAATVGGIEICTVYNCTINPVSGVWGGRDIADICWLEKWHDVAGTKEIWFAPTAAAGAVPAWILVQSLTAAVGALKLAGTVESARATLPIHLLRQDQATEQFTPISFSTSNQALNDSTVLIAAQCAGQTYELTGGVITATLPDAIINGKVTFIGRVAGATVAVPPAATLVYPDGTQTLGGTIAIDYRATVTLTCMLANIWIITSMTGQPIVKPASSANQAVAMSQVVGLGQTRQDLTASRAAGTNYVNSTGKPIIVHVNAQATIANNSATLTPTVGGQIQPASVVYSVAANSGWMVTSLFVVMPGESYSIALVQATLNKWIEIR